MSKKRIISFVLALILVIPMNMSMAIPAAAASVTGLPDDYNGSDLWLTYVPVEDSALLQAYKNTIKSVIVPENNAAALFRFSDTDVFQASYGYKGLQQPAGSTEVIPQTTLGAARIELDLGLKGMLGEIVPVTTELADGALIVGTPATSTIIAGLDLGGALSAVGKEGYIIRSVTVDGKAVTVIAGNTEIGALYGTYGFLRLMQTRKPIVNLNISEFPKINHRRIDGWDKERLYAGNNVGTNFDKGGLNGESGYIFNFDLSVPGASTTGNNAHSSGNAKILPIILDRYVVAARALASVGINEFNLNNVNSNSAYISEYVIRQEAALADLLRPYGIKICLSTNYGAPTMGTPNQNGTGGSGKYWADDTVDIGDANAATINSQAYKDWWYTKTVQIQKRIPDFCGYTVKANSEGQAGPQNYGNTHAYGANNMGARLAELGVTIFWRSFVYEATVDNDRLNRAYMEFGEADKNHEFPDHIFVQTKNGPLDFQSREIFHPMFGRMKNTNQAIEFQITMEYLGHTTYMTFLGPLYEEVLKSDTYANGPGTLVGEVLDGTAQGQSDTAMVGVNNFGNHETLTGHNFLQANTYTFGRQAWDWTLNSEDIAEEWTRMTWSNDEEVLNTIVDMMMGSREAVVASQGPLGLMHQQAQNATDTEHYEPAQWDFSASQDDWTPSYYNKAMRDGIGFRRTVAGRLEDLLPLPVPGDGKENYYPLVNQFFSPLTEILSDLKTCPEEYLLAFHHVPWDYKLKNGKTVYEELIYRPQMAVQYATQLRETWLSLQGKIDAYRWQHTMGKLIGQEYDMSWWRDMSAEYWRIVNGKDMPTDTAPLSVKIEVAGKVHGGFDLNYGTTSRTSGNGTDAIPTYLTGINYPKSGVGTRPYTIYVPFGTTVPTIDNVIPYSADAEVTIIKQPVDINDTAVVKVSKTDYFGKITQNYTFKFQYDTTLSGITIDGIPMNSFAANKTTYNAYTASTAPVVAATANDPAATVDIVQTNTVPSTATITVSNNGAATTVYTVKLGASGFDSIDDFSSDILGSNWTKVRENAANVSLTSVPGALTITTEAGDLRGSNNTAKNLILRDAPNGDWTIESKVNFSRKPTVNNEQAGIIAYLDDGNYIMLTWKMRASNGGVQDGTHGVEFVREQNGGSANSIVTYRKDVSERGAGVNQDQIWLRLEKRGNVYFGYFSNNGVDWRQTRLAGSTGNTPSTSNLTHSQTLTKVGMVTMNQTANVSALAPLNVSYDYFKVWNTGEKVEKATVSTVKTLVAGVPSKITVNVDSDLTGLTVNMFGKTATVENGKAKFDLASSDIPTAGTYNVDVLDNGTIVGTTTITVTAPAVTLWTPALVISGTNGVVVFADVVALAANASATVNGNPAALMSQPVGKIVTVPNVSAGDVVVLKGVKYPNLFPSYSFTFTLNA